LSHVSGYCYLRPPAVKTKQDAQKLRWGGSTRQYPIASRPAMSDPAPCSRYPRPRPSAAAHAPEILDAAEREIGRKGFAEASISTITARPKSARARSILYSAARRTCCAKLVLRMGAACAGI